MGGWPSLGSASTGAGGRHGAARHNPHPCRYHRRTAITTGPCDGYAGGRLRGRPIPRAGGAHWLIDGTNGQFYRCGRAPKIGDPSGGAQAGGRASRAPVETAIAPVETAIAPMETAIAPVETSIASMETATGRSTTSG